MSSSRWQPGYKIPLNRDFEDIDDDESGSNLGKQRKSLNEQSTLDKKLPETETNSLDESLKSKKPVKVSKSKESNTK